MWVIVHDDERREILRFLSFAENFNFIIVNAASRRDGMVRASHADRVVTGICKKYAVEYMHCLSSG